MSAPSGNKTSEEFSLETQDVGVSEFNMSEAKIELAKMVLLSLAMFVGVVFLSALIPEGVLTQRGEKIIDNILQSIVPIVSMVIGYYFAKD